MVLSIRINLVWRIFFMEYKNIKLFVSKEDLEEMIRHFRSLPNLADNIHLIGELMTALDDFDEE